MKRRDFIARVSGTAGLALLGASASAARPCWPQLAGATGSTVCSPADFEADWDARKSGPGVVWHHDFRNEAEVDNFRWTGGDGWGNDPTDMHPLTAKRGTVNWDQADGVTGGACLATLRKAGTIDGGNWWRPFSPMTGAGNGRGEDDPGAAGTVPVQSWVPTPSGSQTAQWDNGWYGNPAYQDGRFDGHDFWIQSRVKLHPNRQEEPAGGKLFYFTRADRSNTSQEIVTKSLHNGSVVGSAAFFVYRSGGVALSSDPPGGAQPNSEFPGYWAWPFNQWVTLLYHVRGGLNGNADTLFEVWVDWDGTKKVNDYIKIWDQPTVRLPYGTGFPFGHNAIIASGYMNGANFSQDIWQRYDQIILSKSFIPCPQL